MLIRSCEIVEKPAPRFEGEALDGEFRRLLEDIEHNPELCFVVGNSCYPRRRLLRDKCRVFPEGSIFLVAHIVGDSHSEERFYIRSAGELAPQDGKRVTALVVGYPQSEVASVSITNTHLGVVITTMPDGSRHIKAKQPELEAG